MRTALLILMTGFLLVGCSKDGSGNRLANGGEMVIDPQPTDANLPGPNE